MSHQKKLSRKLTNISSKVQKILSVPSSEFDYFQEIEFEVFLDSHYETIKQELSKIHDISLINLFTKDVPAYNLPHKIFPEFVWDEPSFADNLYMNSENYNLFTEKVRSLVHLISQVIDNNDGICIDLIESIPHEIFSNKSKIYLLIGKHECIIDLINKNLWKDESFVDNILFNNDIPNRENIDNFSYIKIIKMIPENIMDDSFCEKFVNKFQLGYSQIPAKYQNNPELAIISLQKHIANLDSIPSIVIENPDVVMQAVEATKILDVFQNHPYDSYNPLCHLESLYKSKLFQKLNIFNIEPFKIPGHSQEFIKLINNEYSKLKISLENKKEFEVPALEMPKLIPNNTNK